jgi:predicted dehydrogenase
LGGIGQRHLRNLRTLIGEDLEVHAHRVRGHDVVLTDGLEVGGHDLDAAYGIIRHTSLEQALAQRPDAAFVCNPTSMHVASAGACVQAGTPVFMEKPVSGDLVDVGALLLAAETNRVPVYVGFQLRFHPGVRRVKELLGVGDLGRVISVHAEIGEYLPNWHRYEDYRTGYAARADLGGGVVATQTHEIDLLYWFFGLPKSVLTVGGKLSDLEVDVEDVASTVMRYEGPQGRFPVLLHQDYVQRQPTRRIKLIGTQRTVSLDLAASRLTVVGTEGTIVEEDEFGGFVRNDMFRSQMEHFLRCVRHEEAPLVDLNDGIQSLRLTVAMKRSLRDGREVSLAEVTT